MFQFTVRMFPDGTKKASAVLCGDPFVFVRLCQIAFLTRYSCGVMPVFRLNARKKLAVSL